jgi:ubiquinone/menaquinone biosynthesis C-methylase UbiE
VGFDFNARAKEFDVMLGESHKYYVEMKVKLLQEELEKRVPKVSDLALLDVGCGTGLAEELFVVEERYLVGLDLAGHMLQLARVRCGRASFVCADASQGIPFADNTFDAAFCFALMHHLRRHQRQSLMREIVRVTKPDGYVMTFEHNAANPYTRHVVRKCVIDQAVELIPSAEMVSLHREAGLQVVALRYLVFFPRMLSFLGSLESLLRSIPFGGQYEVVARK